MKYYEIRQDIECDYGVVDSPRLPRSPSGITESFLAGRAIKLALPNPLVLTVDFPKGVPLSHFMGNVIPVFSAAFVDALRSAGVDNFELFPALLRNPDTGEEWKGYQAFNEIGLVDAASESGSASNVIMPGGTDPGQVPELVSYTKLVLDGAKARNLLMFRLARDPTTLLLHESVVATLNARQPPGGWGITLKEIAVV